MDWKLELIVVPVSDIDRAKAFYEAQAGFTVLVDHSAGEDFRVVQLNPAGSACAIALMRNLEAPGSLDGLHLVVEDIEAARAQLVGNAVDISEVSDMGGVKYAFLSDPDGNSWALQQVRR